MMTLNESVISNRKHLISELPLDAMCIINANDVFPGNADGTLPYRPNADIFYLTGITQEETALMHFPGHPDPLFREVLFIQHVDEDFVKWHGRRLSMDEAAKISGITTIYWSYELESIVSASANFASSIYLNTIEHPRSENIVETREQRFNSWCMERFPLHRIERLAPILGKLRSSKNEFEIECLQKACDISGRGFRRLLNYIKPGVNGRQVMAELYHEYLQHGGDWAHYEPIVASGSNSCILHYISNENVLKDGDLVLIDAAASYNQYSADLTRTIPVNGKFTPRQKAVYNAVLSIHNNLKSNIRSGMFIHDIQAICDELTMEQLCKLGVTTTSEIKQLGKSHFKNKYAYHNFGHYLGLAVHDVGNIFEPIPENAIITIEPGIYIQDENIGVRIENNVLVTSSRSIDLMKDIPIEAGEVEAGVRR